MTRTRAALALLVAACGALFVWYAVFQVDDAFIVYRYAENLAAGRGFVFNPGERVEGVTCFLWTLVLAAAAAAGAPLPATAPVLTWLAALSVLALLPGLAARLDGRDRWDGRDLVAPALLAAHPAFAYWSVGALESVPYALLLVVAVRAQRSERRPWGSALATTGALLMRPEAPVVAAVLAADRAGAFRPSRERLRDLAAWTGAVTLPFLAFLLFRHAYFGDWLPNTFYAKVGDAWAARLELGLNYTAAFLAALVRPAAPLAPAAAWAWVLGAALLGALLVWALRRPGLRVAAGIILATMAAVLVEGGDWMILHRFYVPTLPFVAALASLAARPRPDAGRRGRWGPRAVAVALALLGVLWVVHGVRQRNGPRGLAVQAEGYRHAHVEVARWLRAHARPGDAVALMDVGIVGYQSGLRVIDLSGLVDAGIARAPGGFLEKAYPPESILARDPRFVVLVDGFWIDTRIALHPAFLQRYRLAFARNHRFNWTPPSSYTLHVFERVEPDGHVPGPRESVPAEPGGTPPPG